MKTQKTGFTIIEVMLTLVITGLMIAAAGVMARQSITNQRYGDSVESLKDFFQSQYSQTSYAQAQSRNIEESKCQLNVGGINTRQQTFRGKSDCLLVGRLLKIDYVQTADQQRDTVVKGYTVIGQECDREAVTADNSNQSQDTKCFRRMFLRILEEENQPLLTYTPEWDAAMRVPEPRIPNSYKYVGAGDSQYILILKSPLSGSLRTYINQGAVANSSLNQLLRSTSGLISDANLKTPFVFCVQPKDGASPLRAIRIHQDSANASGVEIMPVDEDYKTIDGVVVKAVKC